MILGEIYHEIYNDVFTYEYLDKRIMLQKAVYLLENMGLNIGDYSFSWDKYGPYSLRLDGDSKYCINNDSKYEKIMFSERARKCFNKLKGIIQGNKTGYKTKDWVECIASVHYLYYVNHINKEKILKNLPNIKSHLSITDGNKRAMEIASELGAI